MSFFTWIKGAFKIGSKGGTSAGKNITKITIEKGGKYIAEGGKVVSKAGKAASGAARTITGGAVAVGAVIIASLSGAVTYLLSGEEVIGGLSVLDIILICGGGIVVLIIYKKVKDHGKEEAPDRNTKGGRKR